MGARCVTLCVLLGAVAGLSGPAWASTAYRFDNSGYLGDALLLPDWAATLERHNTQATQVEHCLAGDGDCPRQYKGLRHLLARASVLPSYEQIKLVNFYVNRKRYRDDRTSEQITPLSDEPVRYRSRWATLDEFLRRGGDCEDYATTKYFILRRLGFAAEQLRIAVTVDRFQGGYHALLIVQQADGKVLLLDSDNRLRSSNTRAYRFIYSMNENSIWDHEAEATVSRLNTKPLNSKENAT